MTFDPAARPFLLVEGMRAGASRRFDAGTPAINDVLAVLQPRLHRCGHHPRFAETDREGVRTVGIDRITRSYLVIDGETLAYRKVDP